MAQVKDKRQVNSEIVEDNFGEMLTALKNMQIYKYICVNLQVV